MSSADKLRADLARPTRRRPAAVEPATVDVPEAPVRRARDKPARTKKVRMTVDLEPVEFDDFRELRITEARQRGLTRINGTDVVVALLRRFMRDEQLRTDILDTVEREGQR